MVKRNKKETIYKSKISNKNKNNIHIYIDNSKKTKRGGSGYRKSPSFGSSTIIHTNSPQQPYPVYIFGENKPAPIANVPLAASQEPQSSHGNRLDATPKSVDNTTAPRAAARADVRSDRGRAPSALGRVPTILEEKDTVPNIATITSRRHEKRFEQFFDDSSSDENDDIAFTPMAQRGQTPAPQLTERQRRKREQAEKIEAEKEALRKEIKDLGGHSNWERSNNVKDLRRERNKLRKQKK